jgi:two-component system cell cycle sensor histidine kinase/response regulator CckA
MGSWVWNIDEDLVLWSDEMFRILGYDASRDVVSAEQFFARVHPDDRARVQDGSRRVIAGEPAPRVIAYRLQHPDGRVRHVSMNTDLVGGESRRLVGTLLDITESRESARCLEQAHDLLQAAEAIAHLGSWEHSLEHGSVEWSQELYRILGLTPTSLPSMAAFAERVHPEDRDAFELAHAHAARSGEAVETSTRIVRPSGELRYTRIKLVPLRDDAGGCTHTRAAVLDVSDLTVLQTRLAQAEKMEAVGRLAGGVAHDFNNLLMVIQGNLELLGLHVPNHEALGQATHAVKSASELTRGLLAFGRRSNLQRRVSDLNRLVVRTVTLVGRLLTQGIVVRTDLEVALPLLLLDETLIEQALVNLLLNARDAMPAGGEVLVSTHSVTLDGKRWVELTVTDTGPGMDVTTRDRIFEPFFTTKAEGRGTGLGLAMVHGTAEQHGGVAFVEATSGLGTALRMRLPVAAKLGFDRPSLPPTAASHAARGTILVVEDEPAVARVVRQLLERDGHRVLLVDRPSLALEVAMSQASEIDLLLCDVMMPGMLGPALVAELVRRKGPVRALFMSGHLSDEARSSIYPTLCKPFTVDELRVAVAKSLARTL